MSVTRGKLSGNGGIPYLSGPAGLIQIKAAT
jgi:hypothetical protein